MTIRVLLADDQEMLRATFRLMLDSAPDIEVVGEAATGLEAVDQAHRARADVVVMDVRMPGMDGIEATRLITGDRALDVRVLMLTALEDDDSVVAALQAGASGFAGKRVAAPDLLHAIRTVASGEALLSASATTALIGRVLNQPSVTAGNAMLEGLTAREREIVTLVGMGLSNAQIADRAAISEATAKTHVNRAMLKTGARDRAQLVVVAYETGLVTPGAAPV